jgi:hypothetical protein
LSISRDVWELNGIDQLFGVLGSRNDDDVELDELAVHVIDGIAARS